MRGCYTSGVLQAFMDDGFTADELVGVSAGASNGLSYVSGQWERGYRTNVEYCHDKRYVSFSSYVHTGSVFGMDFIFGEIPERLDPFDFAAFYASPCDFYAGLTNLETGKAEFFGKEHIKPGLEVIRASCSMPMFSPVIEYQGCKYLDGGVAAPIPIHKPLQDGFDRLIVILTRPRGYRKKAAELRPVYSAMYRKYPNFVQTMNLRHHIYNHTLQQLARLEQQGRAIVVAPEEALAVDRFGKDKEALIQAYHIGLQGGHKAVAKL